ncbi:MAG: CBS domain-containing protein [Gemmataceae bacterium]|nr:CBS domain-containing protein [Gemmataceae bacterium]
MKTVRDIMTKDPAVCTRDTPLPEVARQMVEHDCGCVPVVEDRQTLKPVGTVTDRDIACRVVAADQDPRQKTAGDCMSTPCVTVAPEASVEDCCRALEENRIRRAVVVDDRGRCCGMVAQADVARHAGEEQTHGVVQEVSRPTEAASAVGRG